MNIKEKVIKIKEELPVLFLCLKDKDTPILAKLLASIVIVYALSPIDLIPDFIPVLGSLDDVILLPILIALTVSMIPEEVKIRNRDKAKELWKEGKPKRWYYGIPIIMIWILVLYWFIKVLW